MHQNEIVSEPGIFDKEYWQEDLGPTFRRLMKFISITMVAGTILYLAVAYLLLS